MAMKYIYAPKVAAEKHLCNLSELADEIQRVLMDYFSDNLKDVYVDKQYFEFTLQRAVDSKYLRILGKQLKKLQAGMRCESGYRRQAQHMYALAQWSDEYVEVELIDKGILAADFEERITKAKTYNPSGQEEQPEWVRRLYYIDVYSAQFTAQEFSRYFGESLPSDEDVHLYEVALKHSRVSRDEWLTREFFEEGKARGHVFDKKDDWFVIEHLDTEDADYFNYYDIAKLRVINKKVSDEVRQEIERKVELGDLPWSTVDEHDLLPKGAKGPKGHRKYVFTVYNVGQGLATSLSCPGEDPAFYFDFGLGCMRNSHTVPAGTKLPIQEDANIVLSHLHKDHWFGIITNAKALKAKWHIPKQLIKTELKHQIAVIILAGGAVHYYSGIPGKTIKITHRTTSLLRSHHIPCKPHETGFAMYLDARCCGAYGYKPCTIWVSGDQHYDYQDTASVAAADILIACHHGGTYSESKRCKVPAPANANSMVIYSYGTGNGYHHPSTVKDYTAAGWKRRFDMPTGDYVIEIFL